MKKKRRKLLPLGIKKRTTTELPALIALEAIGQPWFCEAHLTDLMALSMVCQVASEAGSDVNTAALALLDLLGKEPLDGAAIEPLVVLTNDWMQRQPNGRIQDAIDRLLIVSKTPELAPTDEAP
ncbi:hypothetical protein [Denitromonas ohlonensis]|uniref:Uncharacterized protein n=2 Tax=Denitromonas TaxID=139331 RepID=A0A558EFA7_9RHOO|nr:hypothetical protein [Denitromonas ohlonensis]TVT51050.1 MAG: hypothetical protein FHP94_01705 [Denitromonas halophila]TVO68375.1 hypothetical protein FHP90_03585 [Denitromonas ohlonensis]TVO74653.1 hypothetical protein FHP89_15135 [Denitromonas ohlonensis]TVT67411.1 MAG: hypothetical protein FHP93_17635 [Denitromonas halophila]TVT71788.1 MAG: hypothetical protein FHP92_16540 [Denitromonas halophila]